MIITIDGDPECQTRMRFTSIGGFGRAYDPKAKQKARIREILRCKAALQDYEYPRISFLFYMPIPSGVSKKQRNLMLGEKVKHVKKPDVDNLVKLYLDCMDGIVFERDQKVSLGLCVKLYSESPRTVIVINETTPLLQEWELRQVFFLESGELGLSVLESQREFCIQPPQLPSQFENTSSPDCKDRS